MTALPHTPAPGADGAAIPPGALVVVRDETWMVQSVQEAPSGPLYTVRGVSEFVEGVTATFYAGLDDVQSLNPEDTRVVADGSSHYVRTRLWLESMLRKTPVPIAHRGLTVTPLMLADDLPYQREAVETALDPDRLRPRLLIADAVGLGKTLEIGMILSELMRRGRGRRVLIVCPRHVLEQMQHELWVRFALPFVRLDSEGVQQVKQKLPSTRNPFTYFEKVIISMDTLKQDRFVHDLRAHRWDAVVIDESHNVTNQSTQNNQLARVLAPNTDALILASATPHNGSNRSFAELLSMLEPTAVDPTGEIREGATESLMIRRHRYSPSVRDVVLDRWAERRDPHLQLVDPSAEELEVARELARTWTHPATGRAPTGSAGAQLFPWTLAKSFLSSPAALDATVRERLRKIEDDGPDRAGERAALERLAELNGRCLEGARPKSGKLNSLIELLRAKGVGPRSDERVVVFTERVQTITWLREHVSSALKLKKDQMEVLHGGLSDVEQQKVVESFKQASSPIRVLITGDIASEGVNLHKQCHELVHFDIPWSLIRIEQRNGRIDRYGQRIPPQITALLLDLSEVEGFSGDIRVLQRVMQREQEAHEQLGDSASLMAKYSAAQEEKELTRVLRGAAELDDVVPSVDSLAGSPDAYLEALLAGADQIAAQRSAAGHRAERTVQHSTGLFEDDARFLLASLHEQMEQPTRPVSQGGVELVDGTGQDQTLEFVPPEDLKKRLIALPQSYLKDRQVLERLRLTHSRALAEKKLTDALNDATNSQWPQFHFLGPLHPVLEWAADRSLATLGRGEVFAVHGDVGWPLVVLQGLLTTEQGQTVHAELLAVTSVDGRLQQIPVGDAAELFTEIGLGPQADGVRVREPEQFQPLVREAVLFGQELMEGESTQRVREEAQARTNEHLRRLNAWESRAESNHSQGSLFKQARSALERARQEADLLLPRKSFVRPLMVVVPHPSKGA